MRDTLLKPSRSIRGRFRLTCLIILACLLLALLSACASLRLPAISKQKAIEDGILYCKEADVALVSEPQNIRARVITLGEADRLTRPKGEPPNSYAQPLNTRVWFVQMDGQMQLVGGPAPTQTPIGQVATAIPHPLWWGTCTYVLDANTREGIFTQISPP